MKFAYAFKLIDFGDGNLGFIFVKQLLFHNSYLYLVVVHMRITDAASSLLFRGNDGKCYSWHDIYTCGTTVFSSNTYRSFLLDHHIWV